MIKFPLFYYQNVLILHLETDRLLYPANFSNAFKQPKKDIEYE